MDRTTRFIIDTLKAINEFPKNCTYRVLNERPDVSMENDELQVYLNNDWVSINYDKTYNNDIIKLKNPWDIKYNSKFEWYYGSVILYTMHEWKHIVPFRIFHQYIERLSFRKYLANIYPKTRASYKELCLMGIPIFIHTIARFRYTPITRINIANILGVSQDDIQREMMRMYVPDVKYSLQIDDSLFKIYKKKLSKFETIVHKHHNEYDNTYIAELPDIHLR